MPLAADMQVGRLCARCANTCRDPLHFVLALWAIYERRTFRLPPAELLRIAMGFTLPLILINHFANTRLAYCYQRCEFPLKPAV